MTTYSVSTGQELTDLLMGWGDAPAEFDRGDTIALDPGVYVPGVDISPPPGRLAGITLRGSRNGLSVIAGRRWSVVANGELTLKRLTIDLSSLGVSQPFGYGSMNLVDGEYHLVDVDIVGNKLNNGNLLTAVASARGNVTILDGCHISGANRDCLSSKAPGGPDVAADSVVFVSQSEIAEQGNHENDQCVTSHEGFAMYVVTSRLRSASPTQHAAASDGQTRLWLFAVWVEVGTVSANVSGWWVYGRERAPPGEG